MNNNNKKNVLSNSGIIITILVVFSLFGLVITYPQGSELSSRVYHIGDDKGANVAYGQMNVANGNSTTFIGSTKIPSNSNNTMTTVISNTSNNKNSTSIDRSRIAQNVTAASAFTKENASAPIPATGISTPGKHAASYPPTSYPLSNNTGNTNQTNNPTINHTSTINTNTTGCKMLLSAVHVC